MVQQYLDHAREILTSPRSNFKGGSKKMGLISLFGYQNEYDLREGFPLLTTKRMSFKTIAHELLWFVSGTSNIKYLVDNKVPIWNGNAFDHNVGEMVREGIFPESALEMYSDDWQKGMKEYVQRIKDDDEFAERWGDLGPVYGVQWRHWQSVDGDGKVEGIDQLGKLIEGLRKKPTGKKHIVTAWNPGEVDNMALPPCHVMYQATANEEGEMEMQLYQRSCDQFLGVPFNIASYAMFTQLIAQQAGLTPKTFIHAFGDSHFYAGDGERSNWYKENFRNFQRDIKKLEEPWEYELFLKRLNEVLPDERNETKGQDHVTAIIEQLARTPKALPKLTIADKPLDKLTIEDFVLEDYDPDPMIKRAMAV